MRPAYLFDWGDTLMEDLPDMIGKMCDWPRIEVVEGAAETLAELTKTHDVYIASGAMESTAQDIQKVFQRANLDDYISDYFCPDKLGLRKGSPAFLLRVLMAIKRPPMQVTMVGDSLQRDVQPAMALGMKVIWFRRNQNHKAPFSVRTVDQLQQLAAEAMPC